MAINTDVLVIGGGLAGCWAAIRAKAFAPSVTLVDKAIISRSGCSTWAYYFLAPPPQQDRKAWKQEIVETGQYLSNQDWVDTLLEEYGQRLTDMEAWGAPFERDKKGQLIIKAGRFHKSTGFITSDAKPRMEALKNKAKESGVNIVERIMITDLLTSDGRLPTSGSVTGAIGFNTRTGEPVIIRSKATIIASGPIHQGTNMAGDGTAMAVKAGAELMSMEFSIHPTCYSSEGKHLLGTLNILFQSLGIRILNSRGERFMEKYDPVLKEGTDWYFMAQAIAKETFEGRGPIILDMSGAKDEDIAYFARLHPTRMAPFFEAGVDLKKDKLFVMTQVRVGSSSGGGLKIDLHGHTNIPGLYGAGSACGNEVHGTYSVGGINLAWCCTSGYRCGESAARDSLKVKDLPLGQGQVESLRQEAFSPLESKKGPLPSDLFNEIKKITEPVMVSLIKSADRIKKTVADLEDMEKEDLIKARARDYHELVKAIEARNLSLLCKLAFRSALEREESRSSHYRQDYPYRDDINWLRWVLVKQGEGGELKVRTEPVPIERYQVKPKQRTITPSPIKFD